MIIIDNYFESPDSIRDYALTEVEFNPPETFHGWRGLRSNCISEEDEFQRKIILKIHDTIEEKTSENISKSLIYFHCSPQRIMEEEENFHEIKWHSDSCDFAGIIYLTPNPPKNTGTCIRGWGCVDNVYNRLLAYPANLIHAPNHLFGEDIYTTRLTLTIFLWFGDEKIKQV